MPNPPALRYGAYYHIYNRGNNRENIFIEARNYRYFLRLYAKYILPVADTFAYCLLKNHFHFLVRTKTFGVSETPKVSRTVSPSQAFSNLFNAYAKAINKAYQRTGSLFERPFGRVEVTSDAHFIHLIAYIHQNPQKHGLIEDFRDWPYSSYHALTSARPTRLLREETLAWFGNQGHFETFHSESVGVTQIEALLGDNFD